MNQNTPKDVAATLALLEAISKEWMNLANLCIKVVELTENGFTIDSETLQRLRDATNNPKFAHHIVETRYGATAQNGLKFSNGEKKA